MINPYTKVEKKQPKVGPSYQERVKKMLKAKVIAPTRQFEWVANLDELRKRSGDIRLLTLET